MINDLASLVKIKQRLDQLIGKGTWVNYEVETLAMELTNEPVTQLLLDKLHVMRLLEKFPDQAYEDPFLFVNVAEVINNSPADFSSVPHIIMLEAAYTVHSIDEYRFAMGLVEYRPEALIKTCAYLLNHDGASEPVGLFKFIPKDLLSPGQFKEDSEAKEKAIKLYIDHMDAFTL